MSKSKLKFGISLLILGLAMSGCASTQARKLDDKVAREEGITSRKDLQLEAGQLIDTTSSLTSSERSQLTALKDSLRAQLDSLANQSLRLRSLMVKDMLAANYDSAEVDLIKDRLKKVEDDRLTAMFNAVDRANSILGHQELASRMAASILYDGRGGGR